MKKLCLLLSVFLLLALCASLGSCNDAPATYTITFAAQGTSQMTALTVKDGETVTLTPCEYVKDGYTFSGWATQENGAVVYKDKASVTVSKDMTLYPVFTENATPTYKVSFLADGCEGTMDFVTVTAGESLTLPACAFTKTGFSFRGWATSDGGDVAYEDAASFVPSSDLTLYAVFEKDDFTFVLNDAENGYLVASVLTDQTALTIPETYNGKPVVGIVPGAFNGLSVKSFAVKGKNLYVKENVLYSGDKKTLLAYPAGAEATSFTLPREAATVSPYAFAGCSLTSVDLNKASSVGEYAFLNAASLNAVSAEYLYRVDLGAFDGTPVSTLVTAKTGTVQYLNYSASGSVLLKVDAGTEGTLTIKNGCTAIAGGAAKGCTGLTAVSCNRTLASVGDSAFEDCTHLAEVNLFSHIPNGNEIAYLGSNAFKNCTALRYFTIPYRVGYIMPGAFENCTSLAYLVIEVNQNGYTYMPGSFIGCTALKDLYLYAATGTDSASAQADTCLNFGNSGAPNSLNGNKNVHFYPTSTQMAQADRDGYLIGLHPYFKFVSGKVEDIPER